MNDLIKEMRDNGFVVDTLVCDGKIHRFRHDFKTRKDTKESGWYVAFQNFSQRTAEAFYVVVYGCWGTGEILQASSNGVTLSTEDRATMKKQIAAAQKKAETERARIHEATAIEALQRWDTLLEIGLPEYFTRKKIAQLYGARCGEEPFTSGLTAYVPMRDVDGKLWGLQKIQNDGSKYFMPGQRVDGCFHIIGGSLENEETIYLAEGLATGAAIHEAIQKPVVVAFTARNLQSVANLLRGRYSEKNLVLCGDDDRWTRRPNGDAWNPGREAAEEAAKKTLGKAVFPEFKVLVENETTDFNDLMVREGVEAVRDQIVGVKPEAHYIVPLGYNHGTYYLISNVNPQIQALPASSMNASGLCRVQPLVYWEAVHPSTRGGANWAEAADHLMQACHAKGIFRPDKVRGRGVWRDRSRIVYHMGDKLHFDDSQHELHRNSLRSHFIYEKDDAMPAVHSKPLTTEECETLLEAASMVRWKKKEGHMLFAGWLAIAPICGALAWRPHVWLTGPSGTGKSYIMQSIINPLLGDFMNYFQGQTTEAGIRQATGCSTKPVIFDEFETNDIRSSERIRAILELARQASSESDAIVAKGTVSGDHMQFKPRFSMLVSSVRVNLVHEEDRNRFTILELARSGDDRVTHFDALQKFVDKLTPEYGARLFARVLARLPQLIKSAEVFQKVLAETHTMRFGQQYGTLLAGYHTLMSDEVVSADQARSMGRVLTVENEAQGEQQDERGCLEYLLAKKVSVELSTGSKVDRTIGEMIQCAVDEYGAYGDALQRLGIIVADGHVDIMVNWPALKSIYHSTSWSGGYSDALKRLPGTVHFNKTRRFSLFKTVNKVISIPLDTLTQ